MRSSCCSTVATAAATCVCNYLLGWEVNPIMCISASQNLIYWRSGLVTQRGSRRHLGLLSKFMFSVYPFSDSGHGLEKTVLITNVVVSHYLFRLRLGKIIRRIKVNFRKYFSSIVTQGICRFGLRDLKLCVTGGMVDHLLLPVWANFPV